MVTRKEGQIDDRLIGGNASAEEAAEESEVATSSGFEFVLDNKLEEKTFEGKDDFGKYMKAYIKA
jgi:hypothetical protein